MTTRKLSTDPKNVRKRIRNKEIPMERDLVILANSRKPLSEWDAEELARGRVRDKNGQFRGETPKWITPLIMAEAKRRLKIGALSTLHAKVFDAIDVVHKIMMSDELGMDGKPVVDARTRLQAAMFIIEHAIGKPQQPKDIHESPDGYKAFLASALKVRDARGELVDAHPVIDGDLVGDDDDVRE